MLTAVDKKGNRVYACNAEREGEYACTVCGKSVILRRGEINIDHFAHRANECEDSWHYDMSEWHYSMQNRFPEEQREVVVKHKEKTHRADILYKDCVIEFQHSPISIEELKERTYFYNSAGYNIAWVFDVRELFENGQIVSNNMEVLMYKWVNPKRCLRGLPLPKENNKRVMTYLYWIDENGCECFNRVIWSSNEYGEPTFKRFIVSEYIMETQDINEELCVKDFFETKNDLLMEELNKLSCRYNIKYSGVRGKAKTDYICPRTGIFGIHIYGKNGCVHCKHCGAIKEFSEIGGKKKFMSYCCYPNKVNEGNTYECNAPVY